MGFADDNKDLVWDLDAFSQRRKATDFVMGFENKLCVYSGAVEQIYTNYNIFFPKEEERKLVILPNPYAPHDTFNGIPQEAVSATGLYIVPGRVGDKDGLLLRIPFRSGNSKFRTVPLQVGLRVVGQSRTPDRPLLPVLMKGDLRELNADTPCLHLHTIQLDQLEKHSMLERDSLRKVIQHHLGRL
ncbi:hypothetical protein RBH33_00020 [Marinimicrobium sp. ABcell2]|nr:hypothetical protein [Marinimicrobium sp. ABcell2]MDQ2075061.1 hypothetical protein [Marinimicrobium sp. ABcell2]